MAQGVLRLLFLSSSGFSDGIISDYSTEETHIRRVVLGNSELKYFCVTAENSASTRLISCAAKPRSAA
ncbi:MAG: hypothetical protein ACLR56_10760 [Oscillospiraceae bacterium]